MGRIRNAIRRPLSAGFGRRCRSNDCENRVVRQLAGRIGKWIERGHIRVVHRADLTLVAKHFAEICVCLEFSLNSVEIYVIRLISWRGSGIRLEDAKRRFD
jgi:hypothetical protein